MHNPKNILIVQTAFLGDVVLTLPLAQVARKVFPEAAIDFLSIPKTAFVLHNHPAIRQVLEFDKRGKDSGILGLLRVARRMRDRHYDLAMVPHRSIRSALLTWLAKIPERVGFHTSAGRILFTDVVRYEKNLHEIERNLSLLQSFNVVWKEKELPNIYPTAGDVRVIDELLRKENIPASITLVAIAPGTVWKTKRWLIERYAELAQKLIKEQFGVVLIGGSEDAALCEEIKNRVSDNVYILHSAGKLTLLQSAELLRRCKLLVCNDSAPMHLAVAMRTPVVAIFGATIPEFGFAPYGTHDVVVEIQGLSCRPCSIHGGDQCPIQTFVCMKEITADIVFVQAKHVLAKVMAPV